MSSFRQLRIGFLVAILLGIAASIFLYYSETGRLLSITKNWDLWASCAIMSAALLLLLHRANEWLNRKLSWREQPATRFIVGLVANLILAFAVIALGSWLYSLAIMDATLATFITEQAVLVSKVTVLILLAVVTYTVIDFALYSYHQFNYSHVEKARTQRTYLQLQFELLKSQLSPHYLFNCLNTISSLVFRDAQMAEDFIRRLASTYQYILENSKKKYVTLAEEVEFVKAYNYLLQVRFENLLKIDINLPASIMESRIPPITLQMLVENAVKHNVISKESPLHIYISAVDNQAIRIINNQTQSPEAVSSFNIGLQNIQRRYAYLTPAPVRVTDKGDYCITLPVVHNTLPVS